MPAPNYGPLRLWSALRILRGHSPFRFLRMIWSFLVGVAVGVIGTIGALLLVLWIYTWRANRQPAHYDPDATVVISQSGIGQR
jgi:hypothetical protein